MYGLIHSRGTSCRWKTRRQKNDIYKAANNDIYIRRTEPTYFGEVRNPSKCEWLKILAQDLDSNDLVNC
jgi:hypothetical protein